MGEESQLDEMRSAIRGDFERLAQRRGGQQLMRVDDAEPSEHKLAEPEEKQLPEPEDAEAAAKPRRSWLARFLSS